MDIPLAAADTPHPESGGWAARAARSAEAVALPVSALIAGLLAFAVFLMLIDRDPVQFYQLVYQAAFGTAFSWENTLSQAAPLLLAALCVALPAQLGLIVIGGEGAIALGGLAAGGLIVALPEMSGAMAIVIMGLAAALAGGLWIGAVGALRHWARRQRNHRQPAVGLYRHRHLEPHGRRAVAGPGKPEQAVHRAAARCL